MLPKIVLDETIARQDGFGPAIPIGDSECPIMRFTLGITRILEQESLDISIWASTDGTHWGDKPIVAFPQKFYCGTYPLTANLTSQPDARFLRVQWKMSRWGPGDSAPLFAFYVSAQEPPRVADEYLLSAAVA
jgi:hypothetical protein